MSAARDAAAVAGLRASEAASRADAEAAARLGLERRHADEVAAVKAEAEAELRGAVDELLAEKARAIAGSERARDEALDRLRQAEFEQRKGGGPLARETDARKAAERALAEERDARAAVAEMLSATEGECAAARGAIAALKEELVELSADVEHHRAVAERATVEMAVADAAAAVEERAEVAAEVAAVSVSEDDALERADRDEQCLLLEMDCMRLMHVRDVLLQERPVIVDSLLAEQARAMAMDQAAAAATAVGGEGWAAAARVGADHSPGTAREGLLMQLSVAHRHVAATTVAGGGGGGGGGGLPMVTPPAAAAAMAARGVPSRATAARRRVLLESPDGAAPSPVVQRDARGTLRGLMGPATPGKF